MDWITGIQRALDYTEAHLTEEIDYEEVAKQACSSSFHFQRMFGMLLGLTLGDYIRMRRLTLAACGSEKTDAGNDGKEEDSATVNGVVNCMGDFLVLLTDDGTYQVFDFGEDVDQGRLEEGDSVTVTYTGELGSEDPVPVAVSVEKTDAV